MRINDWCSDVCSSHLLLHVLAPLLSEALDIAAVEPRCSAAHLAGGDVAVDAVALHHPDEVLADLRALVLDEAGGEEQCVPLLLLGRGTQGRALLPPRREAGLGVRRQHALRSDAGDLLHRLAGPPARPRSETRRCGEDCVTTG